MANKWKERPLTFAEKERSITFILEQASLQPITFRQFLWSYFQDIGLRYVFAGIGDILFIVLTCLIGLSTLAYFGLDQLVADNLSNHVYLIVFISSPIGYGLLYFLGIWKDILLGTFDLKMTLCLSLKELLIIRMLVFSAISLVVSVCSNLLLWQLLEQEVSLMRLFCLSFSALFLFASGQLIFEHYLPFYARYLAMPVCWFLMSGGLIWQKKTMVALLMWLPLWLVIGLFLAFSLLFIFMLRHNYFKKKEGTLTYVST